VKDEYKIAVGAVVLGLVLESIVLLFFPEEPQDQLVLHRPFLHQGGHAYVANVFVPGAKSDEAENRNQSTLQVYEDGKLLGPQHISSDDIAREGRGLYLFWRSSPSSSPIVFSTSDNSDPNVNGRTYRVVDPEAKDPYEKNLRIK
jgi:hypothetical protein